MSISLIAGLGNPGDEYQATRHNIGFVVVDALAALLNFRWSHSKSLDAYIAAEYYNDQPLRLVKPLSYINFSGSCLAKVCRYYKLHSAELVVVHDDIHLPMGVAKMSESGGSGGHNAVKDLLQYFGKNFVRYRIGIGQKAHREMDLADHVLGKLTTEEKSILKASMPKFVDGLILLREKGITAAMNLINQKENKKQAYEKEEQQQKL